MSWIDGRKNAYLDRIVLLDGGFIVVSERVAGLGLGPRIPAHGDTRGGCLGKG